MKLRIGKIPYANLFPIFYALERECDCSSYEFIEGVPSVLNKMLRVGEIDISPSSSIEYLRNPSLYSIIEGHSISSKGPVGSIFLFTTKQIEELNGSTIYVSSQSETSVALLDIILKKFYGVQCKLQISENPENSGADTFLLIGDDALKYSSRFTAYSSRLIYDLGELWYEKTGLPFVFALWIVRADTNEKHRLLSTFVKDLAQARDRALKRLPEMAGQSPMKAFMSEEDILDYWNKLDYELTSEHKKGLDLFARYLGELSYL